MSTQPSTPEPKADQTALIAGLSAYLIWGVSPLYFQILNFVDAFEIIIHRILWSAPFLLGVLALSGKLGELRPVLRDRRSMLTLLATSVLISINWWGFVWAVNNGQVLQASLGYYINPLMSVAVGVIVLREPLGPWRIAAIALASLGVLNQIISVGEVPWISLLLAVSFTAYGYLRKVILVDGRIGLFLETAFLFPIALILMIWLGQTGQVLQASGIGEFALLATAGAVTIVPLLFYIIGARGLRLTTMGIMQFMAPTLQFAIGIWGGETFTTAHMVTFGLIWAGVATFTYSQLRRRHSQS
ncbi:MAG: EamA family transporter RarD [Alphaproteobacteria bacterium]|nr:EamA family transporter RarD [Alphaproteobacteria bacterium]